MRAPGREGPHPTGQHVKTLNAARLAADVCDAPTLVIARTDAQAATLLTADVDERDQPFVTGERTAEGFYRVRNGIEPCIARGLAYAPYSDLLWMETSKPDLEVAREFAEGIKSVYPDQMLAFNCSPSFNWRAHLDEETIAKFSKELAAMGYRFQFITLAGFTPSTTRCSTWPRASQPRACPPTSGSSRPSSRPRSPATPPPPPARSRHRLLRPGDVRDLPARRDRRPVRLHRGRTVPRRLAQRHE